MKKRPAHKPGTQPIRCAIYARTATLKKPDEDNSIAQQVGTCKRFANGNEWIVKRNYIFTDSGQSGLTVNSGLKDLMRVAAINPKPFDVLLCTSTDRIARDTSLSIRIHEALKKYGVEIRFAEISETQI
jgi:DNA invertase Pin-like site-specific DNA recombinase